MQTHGMPGHLIRRLHQLSTQLFATHARAAGFDITPVQFAAMDALRDNPGIDQAGVAELIAYDRATIGGVINRLKAKGLVVRAVSREDRRAREVRLTEEGIRVLDAVSPMVEAVQDAILERLTSDERTLFMTLARKSLADLDMKKRGPS